MAAAQPAARDSMRENRTAAAVERVPGATRIMGVDPGLTRCGFSMLDMTADRKAHFVNVGVAGTIPAESLDQRILWIFNAASHWLDTYKPDALAIERIFAQEQVNTVIGTAHASGAVISAAAMRGVPVFFHTPSEVKAAVTGSGRADKASVGRMVTRILGLDSEACRCCRCPGDCDLSRLAWRRYRFGYQHGGPDADSPGFTPGAGASWRVVDSGAACLDGGGGARSPLEMPSWAFSYLLLARMYSLRSSNICLISEEIF